MFVIKQTNNINFRKGNFWYGDEQSDKIIITAFKGY